METVHNTRHHSVCTGQLAKGCKQCVQGRKLVLFITGLCGQRCFYCPINEAKYGQDVVYANEWRIANPDDPVELFREAELTEAKGAGITGGDPLVKVDRVCQYIRLLKQRFGRKFHTHLYTPLQLVNEERLRKLSEAGLDEIRFHPDLDSKEWWPRIELALKYDWEVGVEIPAIPGYDAKTKALIDFIAGKVKFLNLNELELSDTQASHYKLAKLGYKQKDSISYGVDGSAEMAMKMLQYAASKGLAAHYCTAKLKDGVQVKQRLIRRAKHVALPFDEQTGDGTLKRGCVYLSDLAPGADYRKRLEAADRRLAADQLDAVRQGMLAAKAKPAEVVVDPVKLRILAPQRLVEKHAAKLKKSGWIPALVEECPTADALELDVQFL